MARYIFSFLLVLSMTNFYVGADPDADYNRIARISYMEGNVSFQHISDADWTAAAINLPLQPGDRIYTGSNGRAEIEFDEGSVYRLAEKTDIQILSLKDEIIQIRILTGLSSLTVTSDVEFEMNTPAAAFLTLHKGSYRFDAEENGDTHAIVRKGALDAVSHRFVRRVESGERIFVTADENSSFDVTRHERRDAWDEWDDRRNADRIASGSRKYLPDSVYVGVSDLDRHGRWVTLESYGAAWVPYSVGASWSPYSVGRWCYRPVWGWTWVSYESWGWLPYHYGRWYHSGSHGWCWLPGPSFSFSFWSPGLVSFYNGPSWVSWCPLGPGDYYSVTNYYYHKRHRNLVVRLNELNRRKPGDHFNRHVRGAFRTADIDRFRNGSFRDRRDDREWKRDDQPWRSGSLVRERLAVQPTAKSFSADPDRRVSLYETRKAKPAVVLSKPSIASVKQGEYVRITDRNIISRISERSKGANHAERPDARGASMKTDAGSGQRRSGGAVSESRPQQGAGRIGDGRDDARNRDNPQSKGETVRDGRGTDRSSRNPSGDSGGSVRSAEPSKRESRSEAPARTYHLNPSRQQIDRAAPAETTTSRDSIKSDPSKGGSGQDSGRTYHLNSPRQQMDRPAAPESTMSPGSSGGSSREGAMRSVARSSIPIGRVPSQSRPGDSTRSDRSSPQSDRVRSSQPGGQTSPRVAVPSGRDSSKISSPSASPKFSASPAPSGNRSDNSSERSGSRNSARPRK